MQHQNDKTGRRSGKLNITLDHWYPLARYGGFALTALLFPQLQPTTWLLHGNVMGSRCFMLLWPLFFLLINLLLDRAWVTAYRKDLAEIQSGRKNGGLHRKTLQALASPLMFIADALAIVHYYLSWKNSGAVQADPAAATLHTAAMATGVVLWIFGRAMPKIPFGSVWGIRTRASLESVQAWGSIHLQCLPMACGAGLLIMLLSAILAPSAALSCAALLGITAFLGMFTRKAKQP